MCITVSRLGKCFWELGHVQQQVLTKFEKDGKAYVEIVAESELGFKHLTKRMDMVVSRDCHSLLC